MGSSQSSHADSNKTKGASAMKKLAAVESVRGRKTKSHPFTKSAPHGLKASVVSLPSEDLAAVLDEAIDVSSVPAPVNKKQFEDNPVVTEEEEEEEETDLESEDEEEDEEWEERLRILEDTRKLKEVAEFFLHPEVPMESSIGVSRCYFDRPSAPVGLTKEEADEEAQILQDALALKKLAVDYHHPELPVGSSSATLCGRNYFVRPSAPVQETLEEAQERAAILQDAMSLKQVAGDYMHPERPVVTTDATACGRNYFARPSSALVVDEEAEERSRILQDLQQLKKAAVDYMHPELSVVATDPCACGRNYYTRASAPEQQDVEEMEERARILADAQALKQSAVDYMHPELPVVIYASAAGRNYYTRASAPEQESLEEAEARAQVLQDAQAFKQLAVDYMHPELPVVIYATATGRNYFARASAPEYESLEDSEARAQVMEDVKAFKQLAVDFFHPERPVALDGRVFGRSYFDRASAPSQESAEEAEERANIMQDLKALKQAAVDYLHPELPVVTTDPLACGRNYFTRPSAPEDVDDDERAGILADAKALKQAAVDFMHPELPVSATDPCVSGRNYFSRASAPEQEDAEEMVERERVLAEAKALKQAATDFMHPEVPVHATDPFACGRGYFMRGSAPEQEDAEEAQERARILADAKALKQSAEHYMHPELPVVANGSSTMGRNYFDRPSNSLHYQMIHTFPPHEDDATSHHQEHVDHFGMDEELGWFTDMREQLAAPIEESKPKNLANSAGDDESNLSRSPSSVMLFAEE